MAKTILLPSNGIANKKENIISSHEIPLTNLLEALLILKKTVPVSWENKPSESLWHISRQIQGMTFIEQKAKTQLIEDLKKANYAGLQSWLRNIAFDASDKLPENFFKKS